MRAFNHELSVNFRARNTLSHVRLHRHDYFWHFCWWRLSVLFGQPHLEPVTVCADCLEPVTGASYGDETLTFCEGCQQVEGETLEITMEEYEAYA